MATRQNPNSDDSILCFDYPASKHALIKKAYKQSDPCSLEVPQSAFFLPGTQGLLAHRFLSRSAASSVEIELMTKHPTERLQAFLHYCTENQRYVRCCFCAKSVLGVTGRVKQHAHREVLQDTTECGVL